MGIVKNNLYLKGLGDLYINADQSDLPAVTVDNSEDLSLWSGKGSASVAKSQVQINEGAYSIAVTGVVASGDGATYTPAVNADFSDNEDTIFKVFVYSECADTIRIRFTDGSANYSEYSYTMADANVWTGVVVDLATPILTSGTLDWSDIDKIDIYSVDACNFYVDGLYFFDSIADLERTQKIRIGCIQTLSMDTADTTAELNCSNNEVVETEIVSTKITVKSTVKDFDPEGLALVGGGKVTTNSVTAQKTETTTVPTVGPYVYTLVQASTLKIGDGFGVWIYQTNTGAMLQETPDATLLKQGYYYVDPITGVVTFHSSDSGKGMTIVYNVVSSGKTFEAKTDREFLEFSMQFRVKGSNQKEALLFFPRLKSSSFSIAPARDDFWGYNFEAQALADDVSGNYYELHAVD